MPTFWHNNRPGGLRWALRRRSTEILVSNIGWAWLGLNWVEPKSASCCPRNSHQNPALGPDQPATTRQMVGALSHSTSLHVCPQIGCIDMEWSSSFGSGLPPPGALNQASPYLEISGIFEFLWGLPIGGLKAFLEPGKHEQDTVWYTSAGNELKLWVIL